MLSESIAAKASILLHDAHWLYFFVQHQSGLMGVADVPRPANTPTAFARIAVWLLVQNLYRYDSMNFSREAVNFQSVRRGGVQSSTVCGAFCSYCVLSSDVDEMC